MVSPGECKRYPANVVMRRFLGGHFGSTIFFARSRITSNRDSEGSGVAVVIRRVASWASRMSGIVGLQMCIETFYALLGSNRQIVPLTRTNLQGDRTRMSLAVKLTVPALALSISLATAAAQAQSTTTTHNNRRGDTVTDTTSTLNGVYTNHKTVTTPKGRTHTNDYTSSINSNGRRVTTDSRTGPNGRTVSRTTTHGAYRNRTTVTGPNGNSRRYVRRK